MSNVQSKSAHPLRGLLVAQFLGAFNDNAWKMALVALACSQLARQGLTSDVLEAASQAFTTKAFAVFTIPFILFSIPSGVFADRVSKRSVIIAMKALEVVLMAAGTVALYINPFNFWPVLAVLGCMGLQSAIFGPAKYGILPELLPHEKLSNGNGLLGMWTMIAIVAGTAVGGFVLELGPQTWLAGVLLTILALIGFAASFGVPSVPRARSQGGVMDTVTGAWQAMRADRVLWLAVVGSILFWTVASLLAQNILTYAKTVMLLQDSLTGIPLAVLSIGIGAGSVWAGRISGEKVEYGLIPLGGVGLSVLIAVVGLFAPGAAVSFALFAAVGFAGGVVNVPIQALIQWRSPEDRRGAVIALGNVFVFAGTLGGSFAVGGLASAGLSSQAIFGVAAAFTAIATAWAVWLVPDFFIRLVLVLLTNTFYRLKVVGADKIPEQGPALIVPNHGSFIDGLLIMAATDRPVRFIVEKEYYEHKWLNPFMKIMKAIPLTATGGPRVILRALKDAGKYLENGELVCIFAEGQITRTGMLLPFRKGMEKLVKGREAPIIPTFLDGVWGSIFSMERGRFIWKVPRRLPYPITVAFGSPMPSASTAIEVREAVQELSADAWMLRKTERPTLHRTFIRKARVRPTAFAFADASRPKVTRIKALAGAIALARRLDAAWEGQKTVGILMPPSVAGALVNLAATMSGRTTVNLNYTAGSSGLASAAGQAGLKTVVTSKAFLEKAGIDVPEGTKPIFLEDEAAGISAAGKMFSMAAALFAPARMIEILCGAKGKPQPDDTATIIFSSGSTGEPKGVCLSHFNIDSNVEGVAQVIHVERTDRLLGVLPFFHSFGYMATLWLAANHGIGVVYHPNPLDAAAIGDLVANYKITLLLTTPTFLQLYMRRCEPGAFGSLRIVLAGAEKLSDRLASAFEDAFGLRPLEGYGATECAPVIAASAPSFRAAGFFQAGSQRSFVGHPLPGVTVKILDPETRAPLPPGESGMLMVKGPNVMKGYLNRDDLTAKVLKDGWYETGDIAVLSEGGFIKITDRLSRFSKIGGEMVPHGRVEEALQEAYGADVQVFAVTALPDEKKGEKLAVLHTVEEADIPALLEKLAAGGLPNLFIPRKEMFVKVDALPVLGTGKIDLRGVKKVALEKFA